MSRSPPCSTLFPYTTLFRSILDEIGRGTSTYDGLSIAWAVCEYLQRLGAKTLFATHYHHLNDLADRLPGIKNYRAAVKEDRSEEHTSELQSPMYLVCRLLLE